MRRASDTLDPWASDTPKSEARASDSRGRRDGNQIRMAVRGPAPAAGPIEIGHAVELFCDAKEAEGLSPRTVRWYSDILRRAVARFGAHAVLEAIDAPAWRVWLVELRATLAPVSVAGYVRCLHVFGNWLAAEELAEAVAIRRLAKPRVPRKLIEPLNDDELRELLARAGTRDQAILLLLLDTGLRVSEAAGIRFRDLRPDGAIKVMGKGAKERLVPVGTSSRRAIGRYLAQRGRGEPDEPVFLAESGTGLTFHGIQQLLKRLKASAGLERRCSPHTFRHTFAHNYLVNGGDVFTLQRILGHTSLDMVRRYVALADTDVASRHDMASPADHLLRRAPAASVPGVSSDVGRVGARDARSGIKSW
jgi:site-specific recombinase XerD